jgi:hypothetical protein
LPRHHEAPFGAAIGRFFAKVAAVIGVVFDVWAEAQKQATRAHERYPFSVE